MIGKIVAVVDAATARREDIGLYMAGSEPRAAA